MNKLQLLIFRLFVNIGILFYRDIWVLKDKINCLSASYKKRLLICIFEKHLGKRGSWIGYETKFSNTPCFPHGICGIFISGGVVIGKNCVIFQHVTIGSNTLYDSKTKGFPTIGDNCYIGAGAKIIGNIKIGNNCRIGANCVVYQNLNDNTCAVSQPTRLIVKEHLNNRYYSKRNNKWCFFQDGKWIEDPMYQL
ncbi:MAG: serine acetyltransferase [Candidatus Omnitrophica bacterium]|nr:serine acetyltransferase [Candidatus Omnitrophota bacterium]